MVGMMRKWFGPSKADLLQQQTFDLFREQQKLSAESQRQTIEMMSKMVESVSAQANVFSEYLKTIAAVGKPEVRVMDDETEAEFEKLRKKYKGQSTSFEAPVTVDIGQVLKDFKNELI